MFQRAQKVFAGLIVILSLLGIVDSAFGWYSYPMSQNWDFQNYCYLSFNQAMNFTDAPHKGVLHYSGLVGYWNLNEGEGAVAHDSSSNGSNGTINGGSWVDGKYGIALSFNGATDYVQCGPLSITDSNTISAWIKADPTGNAGISAILTNYAAAGIGLFLNAGKAEFRVYTALGYTGVGGLTDLRDNAWHFLVGVWNSATKESRLYVDGILERSNLAAVSIRVSYADTFMGQYGNDLWYKGKIDEVCVYNRALSASEVATLYTQLDPVSFENYYSYKDPLTNNTMSIHVNNPNANSNNVALVTCTNFFAADRLSFQANNSATVNVWTSLGQPVFTTGVWNSQNHTTTLTLDVSSTAELNWNTYNITTYTDAHSSALPSNVTVVYGRSQTLNFSATQGYNFNVIVDGSSQGQISSYTFNDVTAPHTVNVTSTLIQQFPVEALIAVVVIAVIIAVIALAFKKGYITIEVVEERPEDQKC